MNTKAYSNGVATREAINTGVASAGNAVKSGLVTMRSYFQGLVLGAQPVVRSTKKAKATK